MPTKQNRSEFIFNELLAGILNWDYPPGHRLVEESICKEFDSSRIPVREALGMLVQKGYVEKIPHVGCRVKLWTIKEIQNMYDLRIAIETFSIKSLTKRWPKHPSLDGLIYEWRKYYENLETYGDISGFELSTRDEHFHETLIEMVGNQFMLDSIRDINARLRFLRVKDITSIPRLKKTCEQHLGILNAISEGDAAAAARRLNANIVMGKKNVEDALNQALSKV